MRVLVTGGSGFIGSHVVDKLLERDISVRIFDLVHSLYHSDGEVETVLGSVTDPEILEIAMADCDAVIHLAAIADVNDVIKDPSHAENVNSRGTLNLLEAMRRTDVERAIYCSTTWVYSDCAESFVDEGTEIAPPSHLYTATKLAGEMYCKAYSKLYNVESTILRFGIPYGPRAREAAVVPIFVSKAVAGEPLTVAGTGDQFRKFVYVEDLAEGVALALQPVAANRSYNLASNETVTVMQIAEAVRDIVGDCEILQTEARKGDFPGKEVSTERARRELGWVASTPFVEGLEQYIEWHCESKGLTLQSLASEDAKRL